MKLLATLLLIVVSAVCIAAFALDLVVDWIAEGE